MNIVKRVFAVGVVVWSLGSSVAIAAMSIHQFEETRTTRGVVVAILEIQDPEASLVEYLVEPRNHALILADLLAESKAQVWQEFIHLRPDGPSDVQHLVASFFANYAVSLGAAGRVAGYAGMIAPEIVYQAEEAAARGNILFVREMGRAPYALNSNRARDLALEIARGAKYSNFLPRSETIHYAVGWHAPLGLADRAIRDAARSLDISVATTVGLVPSRAANDATVPWVTECLLSIADQLVETLHIKSYFLSELYTLSMMVRTWTPYKNNIYEAVLADMPANLDYNQVVDTLEDHIWENPALAGNPFVEYLKPSFDLRVTRNLFTTLSPRVIPRIGNRTFLGKLPKEMVRMVGETLLGK